MCIWKVRNSTKGGRVFDNFLSLWPVRIMVVHSGCFVCVVFFVVFYFRMCCAEDASEQRWWLIFASDLSRMETILYGIQTNWALSWWYERCVRYCCEHKHGPVACGDKWLSYLDGGAEPEGPSQEAEFFLGYGWICKYVKCRLYEQ